MWSKEIGPFWSGEASRPNRLRETLKCRTMHIQCTGMPGSAGVPDFAPSGAGWAVLPGGLLREALRDLGAKFLVLGLGFEFGDGAGEHAFFMAVESNLQVGQGLLYPA